MTEFSRPDPFEAEARVERAIAVTGTAPAVDTLAGMGAALLDMVRASAAQLLIDLPTRQMVYMAPIPADCEQVGVLFSGWNIWPVQITPSVPTRQMRWMAGFSVIITRTSPAVANGKTGLKKAVPPDAMIAASNIASADAEVLLGVVNRLSEIGPDVSVVAHAPQGTLQTVELNVQLLSTGSL